MIDRTAVCALAWLARQASSRLRPGYRASLAWTLNDYGRAHRRHSPLYKLDTSFAGDTVALTQATWARDNRASRKSKHQVRPCDGDAIYSTAVSWHARKNRKVFEGCKLCEAIPHLVHVTSQLVM